ncbi:MAG: hypothetical protein LBL33_04205 [Tannerella sp.]|jgi:hypothetical protein|nr:hypothetical protein [Tannerella sp.]
MKKHLFVFICFLFIANNSSAQYAYPAYNTANLMSRMAQNDPYLYWRYQKASRLAGFGLGLVIGGTACMVIGAATGEQNEIKSGNTTTVEVTGTGAAIAGAGLICAIVGTPLMITGYVKRGNVKRMYLREYGDMAFKPSPSPSCLPHLKINSSFQHVGLAYVF